MRHCRLSGIILSERRCLEGRGYIVFDPHSVGLVGNVLEYWGGTPGEEFTIVQIQGFSIELLVLLGSVVFGLTYR
jgi:hypothetical protein